jgi:hypothetical protein
MDNKQYVPQIKVRTAVRAGEGGGYVNGVWYADMSGACGASPTPTPPPPTPTPPTSGGGYVNGVWYSDMSGTCA